jgi:hypothetical protein
MRARRLALLTAVFLFSLTLHERGVVAPARGEALFAWVYCTFAWQGGAQLVKMSPVGPFSGSSSDHEKHCKEPCGHDDSACSSFEHKSGCCQEWSCSVDYGAKDLMEFKRKNSEARFAKQGYAISTCNL